MNTGYMELYRPLIPATLLRTVVKYFGFKLGFYEAYLPNKLKMWLSMQKNFWLK